MSRNAQIRVLLADDHEVVRAGVALMVNRQEDMQVVAEAKNGQEAIELYGKYRPDVALVDLRMPEADGLECLRQMRLIDQSARVLILTTYEIDEDIQLAMQAGAMGYLLKDVVESELVGCVRKAQVGQICVAPTVAAKLAERIRRVQLTVRELDVLKHLVDGRTNKEIALQLAITESTVKLHANHLFSKLGVQSRTEAMRVAIQRGLVRLPV